MKAIDEETGELLAELPDDYSDRTELDLWYKVRESRSRGAGRYERATVRTLNERNNVVDRYWIDCEGVCNELPVK